MSGRRQVTQRFEMLKVTDLVQLIVTFRPELAPPWTGHAHVTLLTLNRLGVRQTQAIVAELTGAKPLPAEVVEQIVAKTDGVPLFVEELTKTSDLRSWLRRRARQA